VAATLSKRLKRVLPIDVCVLGMGTDMHTASIFPDADRLEDALNMYSDYILLPIISPSIPEARLTLTARILLQSSNLHLLVTGLSKKTALQKALEAPSEKVAPVRSVLLNNSETSIHYAA
jgi:6-phosphogluconolactonase